MALGERTIDLVCCLRDVVSHSDEDTRREVGHVLRIERLVRSVERSQGTGDTMDSGLKRIMLPDAKHGPPACGQGFGDSRITRAVPRQLRPPVVRVGFWRVPVVRAAMPEASVDEHRHSGAREHDVDLAADAVACANEIVLSKAESPHVEGATERHLGSSIGTAIALHGRRHGGASGVRVVCHSSGVGCRLAQIMPALPTTAQVATFVEDTLETLVNQGPGSVRGADSPVPEEAKPYLDDLLSQVDTYRDGMLTLLAFPTVASQPIDLTVSKIRGARSVAQRVAATLARLKIPGRKDALQTIAKGAPTYMGREREAWNELLSWASLQTEASPIQAAFFYLAAGIAATARSLPPMPPLATPRLTFARVFALLDERLSMPSAGAHEQFIFAALLDAYLLQLGEPGVVETKNLNASDASAGTAADVQHRHRGQVLEAYEVTASDWREKVQEATKILATRDLARVHILSGQAQRDTGDTIAAFLPPDIDISVLDVREEIRSLVARLDKFHRSHALKRLYDHLVERQPNEMLVSSYVDTLATWGLT